jgi:hypothetical protein
MHWMVVRSQTYYPQRILVYGRRKACFSLVMGSGTFRTGCVEAGIDGGPCTVRRPGLAYRGLGVQAWTGT